MWRLMARTDSGLSLWPERASGNKQLLSAGRAIQLGVVAVVLLIAVHSAADMAVRNPVDIATADAPIASPTADGAGTCRLDLAYVETGCAVRPAQASSRSATRAVRVIALDRAVTETRANQVETTRATNIAMATTTTTDGSARQQFAEWAPPPVAIKTPEAPLTFKQGYAARRAAKTAAAMPAQSTGRTAAAVRRFKAASTGTGPRPGPATVQMYGFPDGRKIAVHRRYGSARADARRGTGPFWSAEVGPAGFGGRAGERQGFLSAGGPRRLY